MSKQKRKVIKKKRFLCRPLDSDDTKAASQFGLVAGPFKSIGAAAKHVRDECPDGAYVLMYEGRAFVKRTEAVTKVETIHNEDSVEDRTDSKEDGYIRVAEGRSDSEGRHPEGETGDLGGSGDPSSV